MEFNREIEITIQLMNWGCTVSECDEIIAVISRGNKSEINKCMTQYAPRIRNSKAFRKSANYLRLVK